MVALMKKHFSLIVLIYALFLISCSEFFQDKVPMSQTGNSGSLSKFFTEEEKITKLETTSQLFVSNGQTNNSIYLIWKSVPYAISYKIERAVVTEKDSSGSFLLPQEENFSTLQDSVYSTSYIDVIISNPQNTSPEYEYCYYYRVCAENKRDAYEAGDFCEAQRGTIFAPPKNISADLGASTDSITINWSGSKNASQYEVYKTKASNGTGLEKIAVTNANMNHYTDSILESEQGVDFYYTVIAVNSLGQRSLQGNLALGYALIAGATAKVSSVNITENQGQGDTATSITINWSAVSSDGEIKYAVYRTSSEDSSLTVLTSGTNSTTYTDTQSLKTGVFYYYKVQAWTLDDLTGEKLKSQLSDSFATGYLLSPPSKIESSKTSDGKNFVRFNKAISIDDKESAYTYLLFADTTLEGDFSNLAGTYSASSLTPDQNDFYTVSPENSYAYYKIKTQNENEIQSNFSQVTSPAPFAPSSIQVSRAKYFDALSANSSGVYPVRVSWQKPENDEPAGYILYRSTNSESGFRKVSDEVITGLYYFDSYDSAKAGTFYYYKVLTVNTLGQGVNYSPVDYGYGALTHEQYMREYNKTIKASHKRLTYMNKSNDLDKLGEETVSGGLSGTCHYYAKTSGLGARITMHYEKYAEFYINGNSELGFYFCITGDTNTSASMDASGSMDGTVICTGMYPGKVIYDKIAIKNGAAGGGTYGIIPEGASQQEVSYLIGEE